MTTVKPEQIGNDISVKTPGGVLVFTRQKLVYPNKTMMFTAIQKQNVDIAENGTVKAGDIKHLWVKDEDYDSFMKALNENMPKIKAIKG
jgi:hypothetical protein